MKAVIFDLDGTLYDKSGLVKRLIWSQILRGHLFMLGHERDVRRRIKGVDFGDEQNFSTAFFNLFHNPNAKEWFYRYYLPDTVRILQRHYQVAPWVEQMVKKLRERGIKVAVFSDYSFVREKLEAIGFEIDWADYLFEAPVLGGLKPCKESFEKICRTMDVQPSECLMVGDREDTDGDGARSVGMVFEFVVKASKPDIDKFLINN